MFVLLRDFDTNSERQDSFGNVTLSTMSSKMFYMHMDQPFAAL